MLPYCPHAQILLECYLPPGGEGLSTLPFGDDKEGGGERDVGP